MLLVIFSVACPLMMACRGLGRHCSVCTRWVPRRCRGWLVARLCRLTRFGRLLPGLITGVLLMLGR